MESRNRMTLLARYHVPGPVCGAFMQQVFDAGFSAQLVSLQTVGLVEIVYEQARLDDYLILSDSLNDLAATII